MPSATLAPPQPAGREPVRTFRGGGGLARRPVRARPATAGQRLVAAFEEVERFPALRKSRDAMLHAVGDSTAGRGSLVAVIESDPALVIAVLRAAGHHPPARRPVAVIDAVAALSGAEIEAVAGGVYVFDFFDQSRPWSDTAERFRVHARATQTATAYLRRALGFGPRPDLRAAALLHDMGKLVLLRAYDRYKPIWNLRAPADERLKLEQTELGMDHALVGGVLARRLGLAGPLARTIELHHREDATGDSAIIRLADMLAHYATGGSVDAGALTVAAQAVGLSTVDLRDALDVLPGGQRAESRGATPSPLTPRETEMVQKLAEGKVYKQIAAELGIKVSTVRTHLYHAYRKLGVVDRAQTVLLATENGWL